MILEASHTPEALRCFAPHRETKTQPLSLPWSLGGGHFPGWQGDCGHSWQCPHGTAHNSQRLCDPVGFGEFICELVPLALLSIPMGHPDSVLYRSWFALGEQRPSVLLGFVRPPEAWRMAKVFMLMLGRCGLQPAVRSLGSSGHFGEDQEKGT